MAKSKVVKVSGSEQDLDISIVLRSSRLKLTEMREFNRLIIDFLSTHSIKCSLVSQDTLIQTDSERTLFTITSKFQA